MRRGERGQNDELMVDIWRCSVTAPVQQVQKLQRSCLETNPEPKCSAEVHGFWITLGSTIFVPLS
jgi:hypothetical protein